LTGGFACTGNQYDCRGGATPGSGCTPIQGGAGGHIIYCCGNGQDASAGDSGTGSCTPEPAGSCPGNRSAFYCTGGVSPAGQCGPYQPMGGGELWCCMGDAGGGG
jgi:hypothetical protein